MSLSSVYAHVCVCVYSEDTCVLCTCVYMCVYVHIIIMYILHMHEVLWICGLSLCLHVASFIKCNNQLQLSSGSNVKMKESFIG